MADPTPTPSTLDKLVAISAQAAIYLPVAGQFVQIAITSYEALAKFLDTSGADVTELNKTHAEYLRREALAKDPTS